MTAASVTGGPGVDYEVVPDGAAGPPFAPAGGYGQPEPEQSPVVATVEATVELKGKRFPIRPEGVSLLALMKFATIAKQQQATAQRAQDPATQGAREMEGLAALYALLRSCVHPDAWDEFEDHANESGAGQVDLMHVVQQASQAAAARPTLPSSGSPGGRSTTGPSSAAASSQPGSSIRQGDPRVQTDLEARGRPDLGLVVKRARQAASTGS